MTRTPHVLAMTNINCHGIVCNPCAAGSACERKDCKTCPCFRCHKTLETKIVCHNPKKTC